MMKIVVVIAVLALAYAFSWGRLRGHYVAGLPVFLMEFFSSPSYGNLADSVSAESNMAGQ